MAAGRGPGICIVAVILVAAAGCARGPGTDEQRTTSAAPAVAPTVSDETGSISVHVVDDELRPLEGATASVLEVKNESRTDARGNATFNGLPPGKYSVVAIKLGYEQAARRVTVEIGRVSDVAFQLAPVEIGNGSYTTTVIKTAYINAGESILYGLALGAVNVSAVRSLECDPCSVVIYLAKNPKAILTEVKWTKSVSVAQINNDAFTSYKWNWTSDWYLDPNDVGRQYITGYIDNGDRRAWSDDGVKLIQNQDRLLMLTMPGYNGTVQQREDFYTSFAYRAPFPDDFTALPPK